MLIRAPQISPCDRTADATIVGRGGGITTDKSLARIHFLRSQRSIDMNIAVADTPASNGCGPIPWPRFPMATGWPVVGQCKPRPAALQRLTPLHRGSPHAATARANPSLIAHLPSSFLPIGVVVIDRKAPPSVAAKITIAHPGIAGILACNTAPQSVRLKAPNSAATAPEAAAIMTVRKPFSVSHIPNPPKPAPPGGHRIAHVRRACGS